MCAWAPTLHLLTGSSFSSILRVILARHDLSGLDGAHLGDPRRTGLHLTNGAQLVAGVSGNANVVGALEDELDVADLQHLGSSFLGVAASRVEDVVHKGIRQIEDRLKKAG